MNDQIGISTKEERKVAGRRGRFTKAQRLAAQEVFLTNFSTTGIVLAGVRAAAVNRTLIDYWNEHDADFNFRYQQARREADDRLRLAIYQRAVQGVQKRKTVEVRDEAGTLVSRREESVEEVSDILLIFMAKARMPEFRATEPIKVQWDEEATRRLLEVLTARITDQDLLDQIANDLINANIA